MDSGDVEWLILSYLLTDVFRVDFALSSQVTKFTSSKNVPNTYIILSLDIYVWKACEILAIGNYIYIYSAVH